MFEAKKKQEVLFFLGSEISKTANFAKSELKNVDLVQGRLGDGSGAARGRLGDGSGRLGAICGCFSSSELSRCHFSNKLPKIAFS